MKKLVLNLIFCVSLLTLALGISSCRENRKEPEAPSPPVHEGTYSEDQPLNGRNSSNTDDQQDRYENMDDTTSYDRKNRDDNTY